MSTQGLFLLLLYMCGCSVVLVTPQNNNHHNVLTTGDSYPAASSKAANHRSDIREFRVDNARMVNLTVATNNYQQFIRQISKVELAPLMSDYFEYTVNTSIEKVRQDVKDYCRHVLYHHCEADMEDFLVKDFFKYATLRNHSYEAITLPVMTLDQGFHKRRHQRRTIIDRVEDCHFRNQAGDNVTVVTGFWDIAAHKYSNFSDTYYHWFHHSLRINMPYILFTDSYTLPQIYEFRSYLPTWYVLLERQHFVAEANYPVHATHPQHVPSADVAKIWIEKLNLVRYAKQLTDSEFYVWVDAGIASFRDRSPFPQEWSKEMFHMFPKDRISYSKVPGRYHEFAATVVVFPRDMVDFACFIFYREYASLLREIGDWRVGSEQFIWTNLVRKYPELFHAMSYDYGYIDFFWGSNGVKK